MGKDKVEHRKVRYIDRNGVFHIKEYLENELDSKISELEGRGCTEIHISRRTVVR